ncbi:MAG: hypothetical protein Q8761_02765, partial [Sweet potato little leaf phytoplasma]|nr:hypothetical protein [Sweet potato little leaf phytoplasma]
SQNLSIAGYADDTSPSSPEVKIPHRDIVISSDEENDHQDLGDRMEEEEPEVIDREQPVESVEAQPATAPSTSDPNTTKVLDIAPLDTSTFRIQSVQLQPAQNTLAPRKLTPFSSSFPSLPLFPPPDSSATLASNTAPSSSSTPANVSNPLPPSTSTNPTFPQFSEREVAAWDSLLGELGEEGEAIRQREERVAAEDTARKSAA